MKHYHKMILAIIFVPFLSSCSGLFHNYKCDSKETKEALLQAIYQKINGAKFNFNATDVFYDENMTFLYDDFKSVVNLFSFSPTSFDKEIKRYECSATIEVNYTYVYPNKRSSPKTLNGTLQFTSQYTKENPNLVNFNANYSDIVSVADAVRTAIENQKDTEVTNEVE